MPRWAVLGWPAMRWKLQRRSRATLGVNGLSWSHLPCPVQVAASAPNLLIKTISRNFPVDMRIPTLEIKIMLEPNPLQSGVLVERLAASRPPSFRPPALRSRRAERPARPGPEHALSRGRAHQIYLSIYIYIYM